MSQEGLDNCLDEIWKEELQVMHSCFDPSFDLYVREQNLVALCEERNATLKELHRRIEKTRNCFNSTKEPLASVVDDMKTLGGQDLFKPSNHVMVDREICLIEEVPNNLTFRLMLHPLVLVMTRRQLGGKFYIGRVILFQPLSLNMNNPC